MRTIEWGSDFICSQIADKHLKSMTLRETKARMTYCFWLCSELLALGGELQASLLTGGRLAQRAQGPPGTVILPSYPAPLGPHSVAAPGLQEGSRGSASLEVVGRKLYLRSGFLQTARGAWGIEAAVLLSHADK